MFGWFFKDAIKEGVDRFFREEFPKMLDRELPGIIEGHLNKRFIDNPDMPLSEAGFGWAMILSLRKLWPDLDRKTASKWMWGYLHSAGITFGDPDYDWTPRAARDLARSYVEEFGEAA